MTTNISILAIDLAKGSFQVCAVGPDDAVLYNRALSRTRLAALLAEQPTCIVAMEAFATSPRGCIPDTPMLSPAAYDLGRDDKAGRLQNGAI